MSIERRDRVISATGEDIRTRYNLDDTVKKETLNDYVTKECLNSYVPKSDLPLGVTDGGTGKTTLTSGAFLIGSGANAVNEVTLADYVIERGSNANGNFVKWSSGRLEMWNTISEEITFAATSNIYYASVGTVNYPLASLTIPMTVVSVEIAAIAGASINAATKVSFTGLVLGGNTGTNTYSVKYSYYAIGEWE